jgi:hypothetical protein
MAKKKSKKAKPEKSLCERLKDAAAKVAEEAGFEIVDTRCSLMAAMFVPNGPPKKRTAFSFTIVGTGKEKK